MKPQLEKMKDLKEGKSADGKVTKEEWVKTFNDSMDPFFTFVFRVLTSQKEEVQESLETYVKSLGDFFEKMIEEFKSADNSSQGEAVSKIELEKLMKKIQ